MEAGDVSEDEWVRSRSWLISGLAEAMDIRCFYFHLKEECGASDVRIMKVKNIFRRLRAECFQNLARLKYCSPLGPLLVRMKFAGRKGVGTTTIEKLESAGLVTPQAISELTDEKIKELKIDAPLRMIEEGLQHTQKVYKGVKEFTNLVKQESCASCLTRFVNSLTPL